jgi:hypothetical protein
MDHDGKSLGKLMGNLMGKSGENLGKLVIGTLLKSIRVKC